MAAQPITSAHKRPHRFLTLDTGALLLVGALACHWRAQEAAAIALCLAGAALVAAQAYQGMRQLVQRPDQASMATNDVAADSPISHRHRS
jgi:hypothetical protein